MTTKIQTPQFIQDFIRWADGPSGQHVERIIKSEGFESGREIEQAMIETYGEDVEKDFDRADNLIQWLMYEMGHNVPRPTEERPA